jgi:hypothetical protein
MSFNGLRDGKFLADMSGHFRVFSLFSEPFYVRITLTQLSAGSPIWDKDGESKPLYSSSGLAKVIPVRYVVDLLRRNDVSWSDL